MTKHTLYGPVMAPDGECEGYVCYCACTLKPPHDGDHRCECGATWSDLATVIANGLRQLERDHPGILQALTTDQITEVGDAIAAGEHVEVDLVPRLGQRS
jgi:hypothetical protein